MSVPVRRQDGVLEVQLEGETWVKWPMSLIQHAGSSASVIRSDANLARQVDYAVADFVEGEERERRYAREGIMRRVIVAVDMNDVTTALPAEEIEKWMASAMAEHFNLYPSSPFHVKTIRVLDAGREVEG